MEILIGIIILIVGILIYFIPALMAFQRKHKNRTAILMLNLFLGWSFIGWVVALVWSLTN